MNFSKDNREIGISYKFPMKTKQEMRLITINEILPKKYATNYIRTAKYNW